MRRSIAVVLCGALALGAAASAGCTIARVRTGRPLGPYALAAVPVGTAKKDVLARLGPPDHVGLAPRGSTFEYAYATEEGESVEVSVFQASAEYEQAHRRYDRLYLVFDADGRVREAAVGRQTGEDR